MADYVDYMLRFDSKEQAESALVEWGFARRFKPSDFHGEVIVGIPPHALDVIGIIQVPGEAPPPTDDITVVIAEYHIDISFVELPGYHINLRTVDNYPELEPYRVFPANPLRQWA